MSVTTYNVDAGKDRATIELSGETKVVFSFDPNIIAVEAVSGSVNVSLDEGATAGDDGCDTLSEGQSTRMNPIADKCIYVNGTGTVKVWGGRSGEDCPFKSGAKGGGGSGDGYSETVLWNNSQGESTPAQYEITLSDSWTNYDAIYLLMNGRDATDRGSATYLTSTIDSINDFAVGVNSNVKSWWHFDSDTQISCTFIDSATNAKLLKVIGIKHGGKTPL